MNWIIPKEMILQEKMYLIQVGGMGVIPMVNVVCQLFSDGDQQFLKVCNIFFVLAKIGKIGILLPKLFWPTVRKKMF